MNNESKLGGGFVFCVSTIDAVVDDFVIRKLFLTYDEAKAYFDALPEYDRKRGAVSDCDLAMCEAQWIRKRAAECPKLFERLDAAMESEREVPSMEPLGLADREEAELNTTSLGLGE